MCGIAGRFHFDSLERYPLWADEAGRLLAHRGPDGRGYFCDNNCELIHRRLAIIDLSTSANQPMFNEDGSVIIAFNGEIYNYIGLKYELERKGHVFKSKSDTEVLIHLYEESGVSMLERIMGMFAFSIYDIKNRSLLIVRDRFGIKPLYYTFHKGQTIFASEMKAILAIPDFKPTINKQAIYDYLGLCYVPEPETAYSEIKALPAGTALLLSANGPKMIKYYYLRSQPNGNVGINNIAAGASATLVQVIKRQSVADVPIAALLSGGIDSSLIVSAYSRTIDKPLNTFNVKFPEKKYDETCFAMEVANYYKTNHKTIDFDDSTVDSDEIIKLLDHFDQPFADSSLIPVFKICKAIRKMGIICTLSGDGGDEVFGGYARFWRANKLFLLMRLPSLAQIAIMNIGEIASKYTHDLGRQLYKAVDIARKGRYNYSQILAGMSNFLNETQKSELVKCSAGDGLRGVERLFLLNHYNEKVDLEEFSRIMTENLFNLGLVSDMLRKVDMMSMLSGIEVRVPFLDEEIVALGMTLPHRFKTNGSEGKLVLRKVAQELLPKSVVNHPKWGFGIPLDKMVDSHFYQLLEDLLLSPSSRIASFINIDIVKEWIKLFILAKQNKFTGKISRGGIYQRIFAMLSLELWLRKYNLTW